MGQAKRKKLGPCLCGSGLVALRCCWTSRGWHKAPERIDLHNTGETGLRDGCYMRATNGCSDTLSREHLISESVLKTLAEKAVTVSGLPWLNGRTKALPFSAVVASSLCTRHNSLLSPIDTAGAKFFEAAQMCGTTATRPSLEYLLSGHDLERWLLRTLSVMGVSRNFAISGTAIDQDFVDRLRIVELLENPKAWTSPLGLYVLGGQGHQFTQRSDIQVAPLMRLDGDLIGLMMDIRGLALGLLATPHDIATTEFGKAFYRPSALVFDMAGVRHRIVLSWEDGQQHVEVVLTWAAPS